MMMEIINKKKNIKKYVYIRLNSSDDDDQS